jgi:hypothetical protein
MQHPTGKTPERVALIAAGPSKSEWVDLMCSTTVEGPMVDEVWGINGVGRVLKVDVSFVMDDYRAMASHFPTKKEQYESTPHPIITSQVWRNLPNNHAYPLGDILAMPGARDYFNHTVPYAVAYGLALGVKEMLIFGADYTGYGNDQRNSFDTGKAASYMACTAWWTGFAQGRGMDVVICPKSPLLDAHISPLNRFYGYLAKPAIRRSFTPHPVTVAEPQPAHINGGAVQ